MSNNFNIEITNCGNVDADGFCIKLSNITDKDLNNENFALTAYVGNDSKGPYSFISFNGDFFLEETPPDIIMRVGLAFKEIADLCVRVDKAFPELPADLKKYYRK